ncbi:hypothetical protein AG1IA_07013 [Rhizoctonia solani AG-1 IA]|uniref:Uncharacterized protein n=1 Tax=Thanatephorus cucumeris (strain AG1-IA) TaxID=983506 RepID=L8WQB5_THACA|nr:hypothetical protein AG1IA_07013 [Rhizoctonia solani AG-1 IA]
MVLGLAHPMANFEDHRFGGDVRGTSIKRNLPLTWEWGYMVDGRLFSEKVEKNGGYDWKSDCMHSEAIYMRLAHGGFRDWGSGLPEKDGILDEADRVGHTSQIEGTTAVLPEGPASIGY